jgi:pimeloyl-ACP methyl ester carboxylesterase
MKRWIFLRGLSRECRHWGNFAETLRHEIADADPIALDLPGNGSLYRLDSPTDVESMAEACRRELARRGVLPPYHLLAMSLGAMVAVAWANHYPEEIAGCVLINTSLRPFSPFYHRLRPASYPALLRLALFGGNAKTWEATILRLTSHLVGAPAELLERWIAYRQQCPVSRRNVLRQLLAAARYRAPLARPSARILILSSHRDALVDTRCSQALARNWQADIALHPQAGHDLPLDDAPWVARQISDWLQARRRENAKYRCEGMAQVATDARTA